MSRPARQRVHDRNRGGAVIPALVLLVSVVVAAFIADQPWTPAVVAAAGVLAGILAGLWGGERLVVRH